MLPTAAEITYFYEVAQSANFSRAASKLGMSQPSVSLAIKRLEKTLGVMLFVRHKQGVTLTKAGKKMLAQVKPLLHHWENTRLDCVKSHHEIQGTVSLGCHSTIGLFLHPMIKNLLSEFPQLTFRLHHDTSQKTIEKVIHSELDIGLATNSISHPDLVMRKLNTTDTTFWIGREFSSLLSMTSEKAVLICDPNISQTQILLKKWLGKKIKINRILEVNSLEIVASLTANGCGIGILPSCFIQSIYTNQLKQLPNSPVCADDIYLIYRKENRDVKSIAAVVSMIRKFMDK